nr:kinesin-like protein KIF14 [Ciona intestinalis]|eukprot:XP_002127045.1 kinesin-like protein KIF14 [Ciona intestinalis]
MSSSAHSLHQRAGKKTVLKIDKENNNVTTHPVIKLKSQVAAKPSNETKVKNESAKARLLPKPVLISSKLEVNMTSSGHAGKGSTKDKLEQKGVNSPLKSVSKAKMASNSAAKEGSEKESKPQKVSRPRTSSAAMFLGKTADGLASSPRKSQVHDSTHINQNKTLMNATAQSPKQRKAPPSSSKKVVTPGRPISAPVTGKSPLLHLPNKVTFDTAAASSPSYKKIPKDVVRHAVHNLQESTGKPNLVKKETEVNSAVKPVRKSLISVFDQKSFGNLSRRKSRQSVCLEDVSAKDFSVTVAVRVRPFSQREIEEESKQAVYMNGNETVVKDGATEHAFVYDYSFWSTDKKNGEFASQKVVYQKVAKPLLSAAFDGYNTCLFAYGQTGSGKSYTIMGLGEDSGLVPRFCDEMFSTARKKSQRQKNISYHIQVSYFEIYNEKIHDLLTSSANSNSVADVDNAAAKPNLRVREHPDHGPYVEGLSNFIVTSFNDVQAWLEVGNRQRATAATGMNDKSSRSHSVFTITMEETTVEDLEGQKHETVKRSLINLVDLAGSERLSKSATSGQRLKEGASINTSLLTLGKVISALSARSKLAVKRRKQLFIPYRDSTLTWILRESLGGNSRTAMIATISPANVHIEETLSTLRYAKQARTIVNLVKVNEDPNAKVIRELKAEILKLKEAYRQTEIAPEEYQASLREVAALQQRLSAADQEKMEVQEQWRRRLEQSEKRKAEEINELKRAGVSFKVDNRLPNLVNLNEDPQLSELLLYMIKRGTTSVGQKGGECDIQLSGALIADHHCKITNTNEKVSIQPIADARTYVNGELITNPVTLHHGDRVVIGGEHFFRLNNPIEIKSGMKKRGSGERKDFEFAKSELIQIQNDRMQAEMEEAQLRSKREMLREIEAAKHEAEVEISTQRSQFQSAIDNLQAQLKAGKRVQQELETIKEEKESLEMMVNAGRRNKEMEEKMLEEQRETCHSRLKAQVLADLEEESRKLARDMERLQNKTKTFKIIDSPVIASQSSSPLRISLLLQEANNISRKWKKETNFSRHDVEKDGETVINIKVENRKLGIWTMWSVDKLEEKLDMMREIYNDAGVDGGRDGETENIFYDPKDEWQEVYNPEITDTPTSNRRTSRKLKRRLSSLVLARASPNLQQSLMRLHKEQNSSIAQHSPIDAAFIVELCKKQIDEAVLCIEQHTDTHMDKMLLSLEQIKSITQKIQHKFQEDDDYFKSALYPEHCLNLSQHISNVVSIVGFIHHHTNVVCVTSSSLSTLLMQLQKATKKLTNNITRLLHGCHNDIQQIVTESTTNIIQLLPNISKYCGAVAIAANMQVSLFTENHQQNLSHRIKRAFLQGGDTFMRKTLSGGIEKLKRVKKSKLPDEGGDMLGNLTEAVKKLLQSCLDLQEELYEVSMHAHETDVPPHYYKQYLHWTQSLIAEVGSLISGVSQLNAKHKDETGSHTDDLRHRSELLWRPTSRIAELCMQSDGLSAAVHEMKYRASSNSNSNNNSNRSSEDQDTDDTECDSLRKAVQATARSVHETLREIIDFADASNSTFNTANESGITQRSDSQRNRRKRILPTSPSLLYADDLSSSLAVKNTVTNWLQAADTCTSIHMDDLLKSTSSVYV